MMKPILKKKRVIFEFLENKDGKIRAILKWHYRRGYKYSKIITIGCERKNPNRRRVTDK